MILTVKDQIKLGQYLVDKLNLSEANADTLSNSLTDMSKSFCKIYEELLPKIYEVSEREEMVELFWDIKEEFRHIDYHIKDASLDELFYIK